MWYERKQEREGEKERSKEKDDVARLRISECSCLRERDGSERKTKKKNRDSILRKGADYFEREF